ncbi:MAG: response regulator [Deltaproteobacteria bacterium]|nr:response regulator [Deltaproteobacteria bacterium]MBW2467794.1 response regulator [Deltaproteobacteria bacterium]MBW2488462.1 response regulator [Deltaproteobacteria bacterium]MBW2515775.1 response regulator [Deltaproteobacteria bacterium]
MSSQKKIKILLVDDEIDFLDAITERLALKGFDVIAASNGSDAITCAEKDLFDVALVDFQMPGMDGTQVLKLLKERHKHLEIIMLTGHATIDSAVESTRLGAFKYLEKPYDFDKLVKVIKEAYEARLKKKFEHNKEHIEQIQKLSLRESPLGLLRALAKLDDDEK